MKVEHLQLKNFRNIEVAKFSPSFGINFLIGSNGQGKTSFLEAIAFLSTLRSFRDLKAHHLVRNTSTLGEVSCVISKTMPRLESMSSSKEAWKTQVRVVLQKKDLSSEQIKKTAYLNQKPFRSSTQFLSQRFGSYELGFHAIAFNPSDHELIHGDASLRRHYLDRVLTAEDLEYLHWVQSYKRVLAQRNLLLKGNTGISQELWMGFTGTLCTYAARMTLKRLQWLKKAYEPIIRMLQSIAPQQAPLGFGYISSWLSELKTLTLHNGKLGILYFTGQEDLPSLELLEQSFWKNAIRLQAAEWKVGHSLVGPHRDDWMLFLGGHPLKGQGSQGEVRSVLLALKLSETELFQRATGHRPIFLMDDLSSELDQERRRYLLDFLLQTDLQVFVTTTEEPSVSGKRFWVSSGMISAQ